jgi:translocation and assembly module TamB
MRGVYIRRLGRVLWHVLVRGIAAVAVLVVIAALAGLVVVQSGWFHEYVRQRIIAEIEHATGGRVELGSFSFRGPTLTARVSQFVLHGKEPAGEPPLLHAESVTIGLRILSFAERKIDVASVQVDKPRVRIVIYADGSDNLPIPQLLPGPHSGWPQDMLNLAVGRYEVTNGTVELDERSLPVNLRGEDLALKLAYDARTPSYQAELGSRRLRVAIAGLAPIEVGLSSRFALEKSRLVVTALRLSTPQSHADLQGVLENILRPHGTFNLQAAASIREMAAMFPIPLAPTGTADFRGTLRVDFNAPADYEITGRATVRGAGYSEGRLHIQDALVRGQVDFGPRGLEAKDVEADALGARFSGTLSLGRWRELHTEGSVDGLTVAEAASIVTPRTLPWNGTLAGSFMIDSTLGAALATAGDKTTQARANLTISPAGLSAQDKGTPIEGRLDAFYDQRAGELSLGSSYAATPATRLDVSGTLGRRLEVQFRSTNLEDVLAALPLLTSDAPSELPLKLDGGSVAANGTVTGPLDNPRFRGQVRSTASALPWT